MAFETLPLPDFGGLSLGAPWYYGACALGFLVAGLVVGYFVWRKGHMLMLDAEAEVRRTKEDLARLRADLAEESAELGDDASAGRA